MFDDYANLKPLKGVAEILAPDSDWGKLYDMDRLAKNEVKVTAATLVFLSITAFGLLTPTPQVHRRHVSTLLILGSYPLGLNPTQKTSCR